MKKLLVLVCSIAAAVVIPWQAEAQGGGGALGGLGRGPRFDGHMAKLFGENRAFSCKVEVEATPSDRPESVTIPAQLHYSEGKSRYEMDLTKLKGAMMPPGMLDQIKALGMSEMAIVTRPDDGSSIIIYPHLKSYAPVGDGAKVADPSKFTMQSKPVGKEKVDSQDCTKNEVTITGPDGKKFEATVWNAPGLKNFPVRVKSSDGGTPFTLSFHEVKFEVPPAALFATPTTFTKYDDANSLMRSVVMKKLSEGGGAPKAPGSN